MISNAYHLTTPIHWEKNPLICQHLLQMKLGVIYIRDVFSNKIQESHMHAYKKET